MNDGILVFCDDNSTRQELNWRVLLGSYYTENFQHD